MPRVSRVVCNLPVAPDRCPENTSSTTPDSCVYWEHARPHVREISIPDASLDRGCRERWRVGEAPVVKDLEARKGIAQAGAALFTAIAGAGFAGGLPSPVPVVAAGVALAGLVAAWRFSVEVREARAGGRAA